MHFSYRGKERWMQKKDRHDVKVNGQSKSFETSVNLYLFALARLRGLHDGLFTGQIDAVDTSAATYRVTFDRSGLGTHTVPDYEVLVSVHVIYVASDKPDLGSWKSDFV